MGYGFPIEAPMVLTTVNQQLSPNNPGLPGMQEFPDIKAVNTQDVQRGLEYTTRLPAMPGMASAGIMSDARQRETREFSSAMGVAFGITKQQNKASATRARAKGKAAQKIAERR